MNHEGHEGTRRKNTTASLLRVPSCPSWLKIGIPSLLRFCSCRACQQKQRAAAEEVHAVLLVQSLFVFPVCIYHEQSHLHRRAFAFHAIEENPFAVRRPL